MIQTELMQFLYQIACGFFGTALISFTFIVVAFTLSIHNVKKYLN